MKKKYNDGLEFFSSQKLELGHTQKKKTQQNADFTARGGQLTVLLQGLAGHVQVGGAKGVPDEPPPPPEVVLPVVQTPEVQGLAARGRGRQVG